MQRIATLQEHIHNVVISVGDDFDIPQMRRVALRELPEDLMEFVAEKKEEWFEQKIDAMFRREIRGLDDDDQLSLNLDGGYQIAPQQWKRRSALSFDQWGDCLRKMSARAEASQGRNEKRLGAFVAFGRERFGDGRVDAFIEALGKAAA